MKRRSLLLQGACAGAGTLLAACGGGQDQAALDATPDAQLLKATRPKRPAPGPQPVAAVPVGPLTFAAEFADPAAPLLQSAGGPFNPYYVYYGGDPQPDGPSGFRGWSSDLQVYTTAAYPPAPYDPLSVAGGVLSITARPAPAGCPLPYVSGCLETSKGFFYDPAAVRAARPGFEQKYGYWEIRARVPRAKGVWPAFWLNGGKLGPSDAQGELDIFEMIGDGVVYQTGHDWWADTHTFESRGVQPGFDHAAAFHTYSLAWSATAITWYIDGVATCSASPALVARYRDLCGPMFLVMNIAIGGDWPGAPDASTAWPQAMDIDYVRTWALA
jgi:hypothetical protein